MLMRPRQHGLSSEPGLWNGEGVLRCDEGPLKRRGPAPTWWRLKPVGPLRRRLEVETVGRSAPPEDPNGAAAKEHGTVMVGHARCREVRSCGHEGVGVVVPRKVVERRAVAEGRFVGNVNWHRHGPHGPGPLLK